MTLTRIVLTLFQESDQDWRPWMQTWDKAPSPDVTVDATLVNGVLRCSWSKEAEATELFWTDREILTSLKDTTPAEVAGILLWRLARMASEPGELDALIRQLVKKETGLDPEVTPFVRKGTIIATRMDANTKKDAQSTQLVDIRVDQHGTLVRLSLANQKVRAVLDRFLRRHLWIT